MREKDCKSNNVGVEKAIIPLNEWTLLSRPPYLNTLNWARGDDVKLFAVNLYDVQSWYVMINKVGEMR